MVVAPKPMVVAKKLLVVAMKAEETAREWSEVVVFLDIIMLAMRHVSVF
jgi:hypothetical protein